MKRYLVFGLSALFVLAAAGATLFTERVVAPIAAAFLYMVATVAQPFVGFARWSVAAVQGGPALAYDGPPVHSLRHEAGTSRISAARNV